MAAFIWTAMVVWVFEAVVTTIMVGKSRKPVTTGAAAISILWAVGAVIWGLSVVP